MDRGLSGTGTRPYLISVMIILLPDAYLSFSVFLGDESLNFHLQDLNPKLYLS